jgi:hypothetical protein
MQDNDSKSTVSLSCCCRSYESFFRHLPDLNTCYHFPNDWGQFFAKTGVTPVVVAGMKFSAEAWRHNKELKLPVFVVLTKNGLAMS